MIIAFNEVYFGKTRNILDAEKLLSEVRKEYSDENPYTAAYKI